MVNILGLQPGGGAVSGLGHLGGHDSSACLINENGIIAAAEEERFTREKWAITQYFPSNSIQFVLNYSAMKISDIDIVAVSWDPSNYKELVPIKTRQFLRSRGSSILEILNIPRQIAETYRFIRSAGGDLTGLSKKRISREIHRRLNSTTDSSFSGDIFFIPHHKSHAASAYRCNDYDESIVITADGGGT